MLCLTFSDLQEEKVNIGVIPLALETCFSFLKRVLLCFITLFFLMCKRNITRPLLYLHSSFVQFHIRSSLPRLCHSRCRHLMPSFSTWCPQNTHLPLTSDAATQNPSYAGNVVFHFPSHWCNTSVWQQHAISGLQSTCALSQGWQGTLQGFLCICVCVCVCVWFIRCKSPEKKRSL